MCCAYRAWCRDEIDAESLRAASLGLLRIASLDQGAALDQRLAELETRLAAMPRPGNGHDTEARL